MTSDLISTKDINFGNRQTDRQKTERPDNTDRQKTERQAKRWTDRQIDRQTERPANRWTDRQKTERQANRWTDKQTDRQIDVRPVSNVAPLPCRTQLNLVLLWRGNSTAVVSNVELK